jgi:O-acetylserine/cysteine efflux transporter
MSSDAPALKAHRRHLENTSLIVGCLLIFDSLHFIFARLLLPYLPPAAASFYVMAIATIEVAIFMQWRGAIRFDVLRRHLWFLLSIGFLVATSTILTFISVAFIDPGTASLLGKSSVLFGVGLGVFWLRERLTPIQIVGIVLAIGGVVVITFQPGDYLRFGSFVVLGASLLYALHNALFKRYGAGMGLADFFLFRLAFTTLFSFLIATVRGEFVLPPGWPAWAILLLTGTVNTVLSRGLYYLALKRLNLSLHSIILSLSPVVAIGWTLLLFGVWPTRQQLIGGAAVIVGVMLAVGLTSQVKLRRR